MSEILDFDPDALREKYRHERDRRLRPDANDQYVEVTADFRHYIDDPHVDPDFTRKMAYTAPGRTPSSPS